MNNNSDNDNLLWHADCMTNHHVKVDIWYCVHENFRLTKYVTKPSYLCIAKIFSGINFRQCGKGCHILYVIINTGQKIRIIKILPKRADAW